MKQVPDKIPLFRAWKSYALFGECCDLGNLAEQIICEIGMARGKTLRAIHRSHKRINAVALRVVIAGLSDRLDGNPSSDKQKPFDLPRQRASPIELGKALGILLLIEGRKVQKQKVVLSDELHLLLSKLGQNGDDSLESKIVIDPLPKKLRNAWIEPSRANRRGEPSASRMMSTHDYSPFAVRRETNRLYANALIYQ